MVAHMTRFSESAAAQLLARAQRWRRADDHGPKADAAAQPPSERADAASKPTIYPLVTLCRDAGLPEPIPEYKFHHARKWRADYCWPIYKIIVEIEGGIWTKGRHTRGSGYLADMEKYNAAALLGFAVLRYAPDQLEQNCIADLRVMFAR